MLENKLTNNSAACEFSVSEISNKIKWLLESNFGYVQVKGEISGLKIAASGHGYFSLKDTNAVLAATCWRHNLARIRFKLEEGMEVVVSGKITAYGGQSKYQISVDNIRPAGVGAFMEILQKRKQKLQSEGLFDKSKKQSLPFLPKKIGIVTSITGAVIRDIIHRISDRYPTHLNIWPVSVQGEKAADEITQAIKGFNDMEQKPDVIIVARGGGSIEDLWPFNEENVVRATYESKIPIISAVGHETDYTLIDLAADVRAPTPTAAAEFAVPVMDSLKYTISSLYNNITGRLGALIEHKSQIIVNYNRILQYPVSYINNNVQKVDELSFRLSGSLPNFLRQKQSALQYFPLSRLKPSRILNYKQLQLNNNTVNLLGKKSTLLGRFYHRLDLNSSLLASLDYHNVLKRGYAMIKNKDGNYISSIETAKQSRQLNIRLHDGEITVENVEN